MTTLTVKSKPAPQAQLKLRPKQLTQVITLRPRQAEIPVMPQRTMAIFQAKPKAATAPLRPLPPARRFAAERASGWISRISGQNLASGQRIEIELPPGSPQQISALTLKKMLGGKRNDQLLKKHGATWIICPDDLAVDLADTNAQFRLGQIAVFS